MTLSKSKKAIVKAAGSAVDARAQWILENAAKKTRNQPMREPHIAYMMKPPHLFKPNQNPVTLKLIKEMTKETPTLPKLIPRNGAEHFVLPLQRIVFNYCSHYNDSATFRDFLRSELVSLAKENPSVEFVVEPRWSKPPMATAFYLYGQHKQVCLRGMSMAEIREKVTMLRNESGMTPSKFKVQVISDSKAIRPIWSPFHNQAESPLPKKIVGIEEEVARLTDENAKMIQSLGISDYKEAERMVKGHIERLHQYNEYKDTAQMLIGKLAILEGTTTRDLYPRFDLDLDD